MASIEKRSPETIGLCRCNGQAFPGKPSTDDKTLFIADPFLGEVTALDLTDDKAPRLIAQLHLRGHPGRVKVHRGQALIPAGREGLLMWRVDRQGEHVTKEPPTP